MNRVNIQPQAQAEAEEAAVWYEAQRPGLEIEFVLELDAAIERAADSPDLYARQEHEVRRVLLRRFPYAVLRLRKRDRRGVRGIAPAARAFPLAIQGAVMIADGLWDVGREDAVGEAMWGWRSRHQAGPAARASTGQKRPANRRILCRMDGCPVVKARR